MGNDYKFKVGDVVDAVNAIQYRIHPGLRNMKDRGVITDITTWGSFVILTIDGDTLYRADYELELIDGG